MSLEQAGEVTYTAEAEVVADNGNRRVAASQLLFGLGDDFSGNKVLGGAAGLFTDEVAEIVGREAQFAGTPADRWLAFQHQLVARQIVVHQALETADKGGVYLMAGNELAVVEAQTIV